MWGYRVRNPEEFPRLVLKLYSTVDGKTAAANSEGFSAASAGMQ